MDYNTLPEVRLLEVILEVVKEKEHLKGAFASIKKGKKTLVIDFPQPVDRKKVIAVSLLASVAIAEKETGVDRVKVFRVINWFQQRLLHEYKLYKHVSLTHWNNLEDVTKEDVVKLVELTLEGILNRDYTFIH